MLREGSSTTAVPGLDAAREGHVYVVGYRASPHAQDYREFLERNAVPYDWIDVEHDPLARFLGAPSDVEGVRLPVFLFPDGLSGQELAEAAHEQAVRFGAEIVLGSEIGSGGIGEDGEILFDLVNGSVVRGRAATGATGFDYRRLDAEGVDDFVGVGVYYGAAPSDVLYHRGGDVFVIGGANSAGPAALHLAAHARSVTLLARGEALDEQMSRYLVERCSGNSAITVRTDTRVVRALGDGKLERIVIETAGEELELPADALFILIGGTPSTASCPDGLRRDP